MPATRAAFPDGSTWGCQERGSRASRAAQEVEDNRLLQEALLADPVALDAWMELHAFVEVEAHGIQWSPGVPFVGVEEILTLLMAGLPSGPRNRFRQAIEQDLLVFGGTWELHESTVVRLAGARVEAVK